MVGLCKSCPGTPTPLETLTDSREELPDSIEFKHCITKDKAEMITVAKRQEEYFESLVEKLEILKRHHCISQIQDESFTETKKALLKLNGVLDDLAENFTYVVQDEIQGYHWVNDQSTMHPFVLYFKNDDVKITNKSICILSYYLEHNRAVAHVFQSHVVNLKKIEIYFSDSSGSKYKNRKNFCNICYDKSDLNPEAERHFFFSCYSENMLVTKWGNNET